MAQPPPKERPAPFHHGRPSWKTSRPSRLLAPPRASPTGRSTALSGPASSPASRSARSGTWPAPSGMPTSSGSRPPPRPRPPPSSTRPRPRPRRRERARTTPPVRAPRARAGRAPLRLCHRRAPRPRRRALRHPGRPSRRLRRRRLVLRRSRPRRLRRVDTHAGRRRVVRRRLRGPVHRPALLRCRGRQRRRRAVSDFQRHPRTGAPYVNYLHRVTQRGYPAREPYGRPSSFGHQIEDAVGLKLWSERMVLLGATRIANLADAANLDPDDETDRVTLDSFVTSAKDAAGAFLAARRGTAVHEITAEIDRAEPSALTLIAAEEFGITAAAADALVAAWDRMRTRAALEVLAVEATVVDDRWRLAGTLDRIVRLGRDLHFGRVTVPAGTVCILDVKTGQLRLNGDGLPRYWHTYCIQIASYAGSVPYVVDEVPWLEHRDV